MLTQLNAATLKKVLKYIYPMFVKMKKGAKGGCELSKNIKEEGGCKYIMYCLCGVICCSPCWLLGGTLWICSWLVYPLFVIFFVGLGPTALLLKLRQVSFVNTVYIRYWGTQEWLSFFGFANNVAGLSKSELIEIESFKQVLLMDDKKEIAKKRFEELLIKTLMEQDDMSKFRAWMLLNSWSRDLERFVRLLRAMEPAPKKQKERPQEGDSQKKKKNEDPEIGDENKDSEIKEENEDSGKKDEKSSRWFY